MTSDHRDEQLGAALRALEVPDYEPGFQTQLRARLDAETPSARVSRARRSQRAPRRAPGGRLPRRPSWSWRPLAVGLALGVVLLAVIFSRDSGRVPAPGGFGTSPATAAELATRVQRAIAQARTISGTLVGRERYGVRLLAFNVTRTRFLLTAAGDQRLTTLDAHGRPLQESSYVAATATETYLTHSPDPRVRGGSIDTGLASGPPDPGPQDPLLGRNLTGTVSALHAAGDRRIVSLRYAGRPAWRLSAPVPAIQEPASFGSPDRIEIIVDQVNGFPLRVRLSQRGVLLEERRLEHLRVNVPAPAAAFGLALPRALAGKPIDSRYRRIELDRAAAIVGYAPLVPTPMPTGYRRAETSISRLAGATGALDGNPVSRDVVSTAYRRGFHLLLVTMRRRDPATPACSPTGGGSGPCWTDPISVADATEHPIRLTDGALAGSSARLVLDPQETPHIWALTRNLVVTISGDLSREQLIAAAQSLRTAR